MQVFELSSNTCILGDSLVALSGHATRYGGHYASLEKNRVLDILVRVRLVMYPGRAGSFSIVTSPGG